MYRGSLSHLGVAFLGTEKKIGEEATHPFSSDDTTWRYAILRKYDNGLNDKMSRFIRVFLENPKSDSGWDSVQYRDHVEENDIPQKLAMSANSGSGERFRRANRDRRGDAIGGNWWLQGLRKPHLPSPRRRPCESIFAD
ncbi:uncharacterized protein LOC106671038 [Cimex lectularius]|uniref:Uncharacterized protein n=1 Tax=Cimex lectularius TaxID=79782 RepID=A0A8I6S528_CIMLE|nr:uncharacterized protein LOC106671038 [Cimex lectularius]